MDPDPLNPTPAEDTALPFDELSPEHAGLLASWKTGDQTGTKPAATVEVAERMILTKFRRKTKTQTTTLEPPTNPKPPSRKAKAKRRDSMKAVQGRRRG
jgi:hypothetical protein